MSEYNQTNSSTLSEQILKNDSLDTSILYQKPKSERFNSLDLTKINLNIKQKEEILLTISKNQKRVIESKINNSQKIKLIEKCNKILKKIETTNEYRNYIYHSFCFSINYFAEKLSINKKKLNIFAIANLLLLIKSEEIFNKKLALNILLDNFYEINLEESLEDIYNYEKKINEITYIINDNNLFKLSYFLLDLFNEKYLTKINEDNKEDIQDSINYCNKLIEKKYSIVYNLLSIDKALISIYSSMKFVLNTDKNIINNLDNFYSYLKNDLKIIKMSYEEFRINCKEMDNELRHKF